MRTNQIDCWRCYHSHRNFFRIKSLQGKVCLNLINREIIKMKHSVTKQKILMHAFNCIHHFLPAKFTFLISSHALYFSIAAGAVEEVKTYRFKDEPERSICSA